MNPTQSTQKALTESYIKRCHQHRQWIQDLALLAALLVSEDSTISDDAAFLTDKLLEEIEEITEDDHSDRGLGFRVPQIKRPILRASTKPSSLVQFTPEEFRSMLEEVADNIQRPRNAFYCFTKDENELRSKRKTKLTLPNWLLFLSRWTRARKCIFLAGTLTCRPLW